MQKLGEKRIAGGGGDDIRRKERGRRMVETGEEGERYRGERSV